MKLILLLIGFGISLASSAQSLRYFEFTIHDSSTVWQDSSFIAATSDQNLIDSILVDLSKPYSQRKHINGVISYGNDGYNQNNSHTFLWHFVPGQWDLVETSIELCDGRPFSDVDLDTAYWISTVGNYCPWLSKVAREVFPLSIDDKNLITFKIYPNPSAQFLSLEIKQNLIGSELKIISSTGAIVFNQQLENQFNSFNFGNLPNGVYFVMVGNQSKLWVKME